MYEGQIYLNRLKITEDPEIKKSKALNAKECFQRLYIIDQEKKENEVLLPSKAQQLICCLLALNDFNGA